MQQAGLRQEDRPGNSKEAVSSGLRESHFSTAELHWPAHVAFTASTVH